MITYRIFGRVALATVPICEPLLGKTRFKVEGLPKSAGSFLAVMDTGGSFRREAELTDGEAELSLRGAPCELIVRIGEADAGRLVITEGENGSFLTEPTPSGVELSRAMAAVAICFSDKLVTLGELLADCRALVPIVEDLNKKAHSGDILNF